MKLRTRPLVALAGAHVLLLPLVGCGEDIENRDDPDSLVIYSAEEVVDFFAERYEGENSEVGIDVVKGSSGESVARVVAESDRPQGDIVVAGNDPATTNPDLFLENDDVDLSDVNPDYVDPEGYATPIVVFPVNFIYNDDVLDGDDVPETWEEMADPTWEGRIYMGNPTTSEAAYKAMATWWSIGGWDLVEGIAQNVVVTEGSTDPMRAVGNGEAAIGVGVEQQVYQWTNDDTIHAGYPTDGIVMHVQTWYQIANSPSPTNGANFMNYMLDPENQQVMVEEFPGMRSVLSDEPQSDVVPPLDELTIIEVPDEANENREEWNDTWRDIITAVE
ncbi:extracellular solute-binding protein [Spiractinospora alimapuensis]|uniref:ABC transporter substrate-binding protein n=1 Tax=Spiractinospora alimapuensis TaxID=2820884 RepID=UPI001F374B8B|nr:extracellular solute-binding protein [Spiractinospora alimapuensis]QVQ53489.1 extracellular solute-binding protein [Spiractinospora alimapuensis]